MTQAEFPEDSMGNKLIPCGRTLQFRGSDDILKCLLPPGHEGMHSNGSVYWGLNRRATCPAPEHTT